MIICSFGVEVDNLSRTMAAGGMRVYTHLYLHYVTLVHVYRITAIGILAIEFGIVRRCELRPLQTDRQLHNLRWIGMAGRARAAWVQWACVCARVSRTWLPSITECVAKVGRHRRYDRVDMIVYDKLINARNPELPISCQCRQSATVNEVIRLCASDSPHFIGILQW
jgi:hypothetical protein